MGYRGNQSQVDQVTQLVHGVFNSGLAEDASEAARDGQEPISRLKRSRLDESN